VWCSRLDDEVEVASKTFDRIGFSGTCHSYTETAPRLELTWTWDARTRSYVRRERKIAIAAPRR
jgi:hypothetical protein